MIDAGSKPGMQQRLLRAIDTLAVRSKRLRNGKAGVAPHLAIGLEGEEKALFHLLGRGYVIVARRWKTPKLFGDVDLIGWDGDTLCFIEVKTRTARDVVPAEFAVDQQKQRMLRAMAAVFRNRFPENVRRRILVRFDVVSVYLTGATGSGEIEVLPGAFGRT